MSVIYLDSLRRLDAKLDEMASKCDALTRKNKPSMEGGSLLKQLGRSDPLEANKISSAINKIAGPAPYVPPSSSVFTSEDYIKLKASLKELQRLGSWGAYKKRYG